jgi:hypothetical protein
VGFGFVGKMGEKREMRGEGGAMAAQRGRGWCGGGGGNDGWRWNGHFVGVWEKKDGDEREKVYGAAESVWEGKE